MEVARIDRAVESAAQLAGELVQGALAAVVDRRARDLAVLVLGQDPDSGHLHPIERGCFPFKVGTRAMAGFVRERQ